MFDDTETTEPKVVETSPAPSEEPAKNNAKPKTKRKTAAKKGAKPKRGAKPKSSPKSKRAKPSKKPAAKNQRGGAKKTPKKTSKSSRKSLTKAGLVAKRPSALGKTGPKGRKNPKRDAKDGGKFGRKVARARKAKGWSQKELAAKVGITQPAMCNIERATAGASEALTKRLCKALKLAA